MSSPRELPPTIDFSKENLKQESHSWIATQKEVRKALEEFCCFHAQYDTVPLKAHKKMYGAMGDLFNLPRETKTKHVYDTGFFGYTESSNLETTGLVDVASPENVVSFTNLMWPEGNPSFCETMSSYIDGSVKLEQIVRRMVFESFGLEKYCDSCIESTNYVFVGNAYRPHGNETKGMPPHTDKSFLTILKQNDVDGLQVETKYGQWVTLTPSPTSFTVMVGESFMAWSNGRLHSPNHRVVLNGNQTRHSFVLFAYSNEMVEAPEELVDEEHPLLFKPFHYMDLIRLSFSSSTGKCGKIKEFYSV